MANTFELISSVTVGSGGAATIDFTSIPSTYTDLCLKISTRNASGAIGIRINFNGSSASFTNKTIEGNGSSAASGSYQNGQFVGVTSDSANTFSSADIYIPNYAGSTNKSVSADSVSEANSTVAYADLAATLWSNTAAINQITLTMTTGSFAQYSTAYLYGVKNA